MPHKVLKAVHHPHEDRQPNRWHPYVWPVSAMPNHYLFTATSRNLVQHAQGEDFELFLFKCNMEDKELILVGDLNCDVNKLATDPQHHKLQTLCSLYQLSQVINKPMRIMTETTATLSDLILKKIPEYILSAGVLHLGISNHSLIYAVRKFDLPKSRPTIKEVCDFKHFSDLHFHVDLMQVPWDTICYNDPNICWTVWKSIFTKF